MTTDESRIEKAAEALYLSFYPKGNWHSGAAQKERKHWLRHAKAVLEVSGPTVAEAVSQASVVDRPVRYCTICDIAECSTHRPVRTTDGESVATLARDVVERWENNEYSLEEFEESVDRLKAALAAAGCGLPRQD